MSVERKSQIARNDQLSGVVIFVEAARAGNFTAAAERLGIGKSAVGKSIARLEERLGTKLFYRTTRRSNLTLDGEAYFASCAGALDEIANAEAALDARRFKPRGRVRIDMPSAFGRRVILPVLMEIAKSEPELRFSLSFTDRVVDLVEERVDLAIRIGELQDSSGLVARKLAQQSRVVCASPRYLKARGVPGSPDDLGSHDCVVGFRRGASVAWTFSDTYRPAVRFSPPQTHEIDDGDAVLAACAAGLGLAQLPLWMVRQQLAERELVAVLEEYQPPGIDIHAVWPKTRHLVPRVRYVVDMLVRRAAAGMLD
jgi:DNA-binding transcriptional LysR family regulator